MGFRRVALWTPTSDADVELLMARLHEMQPTRIGKSRMQTILHHRRPPVVKDATAGGPAPLAKPAEAANFIFSVFRMNHGVQKLPSCWLVADGASLECTMEMVHVLERTHMFLSNREKRLTLHTGESGEVFSVGDFGVNVATLYFNRTLCKERFLEIEYRGASTYAQAQPMLDAFLQHLGGSDFPNLAFVPFPELKPATGAPETTDRDRLGLQYVRLFDVIDKSSSQ